MEEDRLYVQSPSTQDWNHEDEAVDTLSLSDLMIYDNNGDPQDLYRINNQNPIDLDDQFEFSSELLQTSINNSVVFCGKIIPYKESMVSPNTYKLESKKSHKQRWTLVSVFKKSSTKPAKLNMYSEKLDLKHEVPLRRVSIFASATKPKWYLLMFGYRSSSFSAQMHIRDLKRRQTSVGSKDRKDHKNIGGGGGVGSWSIMRFLGCGGDSGRDGGRGDTRHPIIIKKIE